MNSEELLLKYYDMFGGFPPMLMMMPYESKQYMFLIKNAIENNKKIEEKDLKNITYDVNNSKDIFKK